MDKELEWSQREPTFRESFENTFKQFLKLRTTKDFDFDHLSIRLPVGLLKESGEPFNDLQHQRGMLYYAPVKASGYKHYANGYTYYQMTLAHKKGKEFNKALCLSQQFSTCPDRYNKKPLFRPNQFIVRKNGYFYRWNSDGSLVTITKLIGTTNINQIKRQSENLIQECLRFIFMYCQG